jgi:predicted dehydrogenase
MIRFALFGAGRIGQVHAYNLKASHKGCLEYVIDVNERAAAKLADRLGAKAVSFEFALADPEVEAVIIASATNTHAELIQASARARKAIFCEKPLDMDVARSRAALDVVEQNGVPFFLAFNRRFDPEYEALRSALVSGVIGVINNVLRSSFGYDQRLEVQGERGMLQVQKRDSSKMVISDRSGVRSGGPQNSFIERFAEAYRTELNVFLSNLCSGKPMQPDGLDGLRASLIAECVEQAYRTSVSVPVLNDFSSLSQTGIVDR